MNDLASTTASGTQIPLTTRPHLANSECMKNSIRNTKGKFKKGASGNPAGRPPGSRNKGTLECEQLLDDECQVLIRKAMEMGKKGNIHALRLCLERILPVRKERSIRLELRPITSPQDLPFQFQDISTAVAEGLITPGEGESLSVILTSHARIMETVELDQRVANLEAFGREAQAYRSDLKRFVEGTGLESYKKIQEEELRKQRDSKAETQG